MRRFVWTLLIRASCGRLSPGAETKRPINTPEVEYGILGQWPEPSEIVALFEREMQGWFGTPAWYQR